MRAHDLGESPSNATDKYPFVHSNTIGGKISAMDFSSATKAGTSSKQLGFKKQTTYNAPIFDKEENSDKSRDISKYIILPEYKVELIY